MEIRNYINHPDKDVQTVRLKYQLDTAEFTSYDVLDNSRLIVSSHDFLSIVELSEASGDELRIVFTKNGKPLIASFEREDSIKVQMVMSTMREETLKLLKQPAGATSYKALMGSYIEGRRSHGNDCHELSINNLTESVMSPRIDSFESNPRSKIALTKRKSVEMTPAPQDDSEVHPDVVKSKKQKPNETLTQEEQQEVSQMLLDLAAHDGVDDDDEMFFNRPRITPSPNIFAGLAERNIRVQLRNTIIESPAPPEIIDSVRFDTSRANFASEDIHDTESLPETIGERFSQAPPNTTNELIKKTNYYAKKLFGVVLKPKKKIDEGRVLAANSDSESSDDTLEEEEPIVID